MRPVCDHDLRSALPVGEHGGEQLGRILEVGIHADERIAGADLYGVVECGLFAMAAREMDQADAVIIFGALA